MEANLDAQRRELLTGLGALLALGVPAPAEAGLASSMQRSLFLEMAERYALQGDKRTFRSLFRVQQAIRQLGAWPSIDQVVEKGMRGLNEVLDHRPTEQPGFRTVRRTSAERVVIFSDHHILPDENRQSGVWRANRDGYTRILQHYGENDWTVVEDGDIEDLVILEPDVTEGLYAEVLTGGSRRRVRTRHARDLLRGIASNPVATFEALVQARIPRRQAQYDAIRSAPGNQAYYDTLRQLHASGQLIRVAGNHDYNLQALKTGEDFVRPVDVAIIDRERPMAILHGHQFDQATAPGIATLYGEVISECLGVWYQGPDRTWGAHEVSRILRGGFPNRLSTHGHGNRGALGAMATALLASGDGAVDEWAEAWEALFGHPIAWEYAAENWQASARYGVYQPEKIIEQAMLGKQFFKFRHLDEMAVVLGLERWRVDADLVLGHTHEVRTVPSGPLGRYYNSGAAGRFERLIWALEADPEGTTVVAWHLEEDGACQRYSFAPVEQDTYSYLETRRSLTRLERA
ncbi:MAG: hypothetical protein AAGA48_33205 [Myxococcota bacterium]